MATSKFKFRKRLAELLVNINFENDGLALAVVTGMVSNNMNAVHTSEKIADRK